MPEPRRWTVHNNRPPTGPDLASGEHVEVVEAAPVEAELERLRRELDDIQVNTYRATGQMPRSWAEDLAELERLRRIETAAREVVAGTLSVAGDPEWNRLVAELEDHRR